MSKFITLAKTPLQLLVGVTVLFVVLIRPFLSIAQNKSDQDNNSNPHAQHQMKQPAGDKMQGMSGRKAESVWWFENYARSQTQDMGGKGMTHGEAGPAGMTGMTTGKINAGSMAGDNSSTDMGMIDDADLVGMKDDDQGLMGAIAIVGAGSKTEKDLDELKMASALPGSPGISRLYHVGATGFFLNCSDHIKLSLKQQEALNVVRRKAVLSKFTARRKIEEAEQELWELTGTDNPDAAQIQTKVQFIEKLRGERRMTFVQAVGEAAKVLTDEQRRTLLGTTAAATAEASHH